MTSYIKKVFYSNHRFYAKINYMQKLTLEFYDHYAPTYQKYRAIFKRIFSKTLKLLDYTDKDYLVEVTIVDEETIQAVNRDYRQKDRVTDVISFAFSDEVAGEVLIKEAPLTHLGAILICAPKALSQAAEFNHSIEREFKFLFTHGLLHLLGYDHESSADEEIMFALQDKIIGKRGTNI